MRYLLLLTLMFSLAVEAKQITAKSFLVTDNKGTILIEKNADNTQPIVSMAKLIANLPPRKNND